MADMMTAGQDAIFAALNVPAIMSRWPVYQHVPAETEPPFIVVADIEAAPGDTKGSEELLADVDYVYRGEDRRELLAMMAAGRAVLDGQPVAADGADLEAPQWQSSSVGRAEDGVTYVGLQTYRIVAEPA